MKLPKHFVLDTGKRYVLVAQYFTRGKLITIKRVERAVKTRGRTRDGQPAT